MKRYIYLLLLMFSSSLLWGQQTVEQVEYWFDSDYANVQTTTVSSAESITHDVSLDVSSLTTGLHLVSFRFQDNRGIWSSGFSRFFIYDPASISGVHSVTELEYWINDDYASAVKPDISSGASLSFSQVIDLSAEINGVHKITFRAKDSRGKWSSPMAKFFLKEGASSVREIVKIAYWFNADYENAVEQTITATNTHTVSEMIDVSQLEVGVHWINYRFQDNRGKWSVPICKLFNNHETETGTELHPINTVEYWFNGDYSTLQHSSLAEGEVISYNETIDVSTLSPGLHFLSYRFKDDANEWSPAYSNFFYIEYSGQETTLHEITDMEYWFDGDRTSLVSETVGNSAVLSVDANIDVSALEGGLHIVSYRIKDEANQWSPAYSSFFMLDDFGQPTALHEITQIEYWFNGDRSTMVSETVTNRPILSVDTNIDVSALGNGLHILSYRIKDEADQWSPVYSSFFAQLPAKPGLADNSITGYRYWIDSDLETLVEEELSTPVKFFSLDETLTAQDLPSGTHDISYQFRDNRLQWSPAITDTYTREAQPFVSISATQTEICKGGTIQFSSTIADADAISWTFGDGATSEEDNPLKTFETAGTFDVIATVSQTGSVETASDTIKAIVVNESYSNLSIDVSICSGQSYMFGGTARTSSGSYVHNFSTENGCDSTVTLNLTVSSVIQQNNELTICEDELPFTFGTQTLTQPGVYSETYTSVAGCDSVVNLTLTVNDTFLINAQQSVCESELPFEFGSQSLSSSGVYTEIFATTAGCDSTVTLAFTVLDTFQTLVEETICASELPFTFGSQQLTQSGTFTETLQAVNGCDSTVVLNLVVNETYNQEQNVSICEDVLPYAFGTQSLTQAGQYTHTFSSAKGCDSTIVLNLTVNDTSIVQQQLQLCEGELPYQFGTQSLGASGTYTEVFTSTSGCDSTVILDLAVLQNSGTSFSASICQNELPYVFGTQQLTSSGNYTRTLVAQNGCDSIVSLQLTVNQSYHKTLNVDIDEADLPYTFGSKQITEAGTYVDSLLSTMGCDSIITLHINTEDEIPPTAVCNAIEIMLATNGTYELKAPDLKAISLGSSDNRTLSSNLHVQVNPSVFSCDDLGEKQVQVTVTDEDGNSSSCAVYILVSEEELPPTLDPIADVVVDEDEPVEIALTGISGGSPCSRNNIDLVAQNGDHSLISDCTVDFSVGDTTGMLHLGMVEHQCGNDSVHVSVMNKSGMKITRHFSITVNQVNDSPVLLFQPDDQELLVSDSLQLTFSKILGELFDDVDDSTLVYDLSIDGGDFPNWIDLIDEGDIFRMSFHPQESDTGCYAIQINASDLAQATATAAFQLCVKRNAVGIGDISLNDFAVHMYPNPSPDRVNLELTGAGTGDIKLQVIDAVGSKVLEKTYGASNHIQFNMSDHVSGIYFVVVTQENYTVIKKLLLEKR